MTAVSRIITLLLPPGIGKHVTVQSPGGLNQDETLRMVQAAQYYPRLISTLNHGLRFHPAFVGMKRAIQQGFIGPDIAMADVRINTGSLIGKSYSWLCDETMGGGILNLFGAHIIDLLFYLTGQKALRVHGIVRTFSKTTETICGIRQINSDDCTTFQVEMERGTFATVTLNSQLSGFSQEVILVGREGYLAVRNEELFGKKNSGVKEEEPMDIVATGGKNSGNATTTITTDEPLLPAIYLGGLVQMFRQLTKKFQHEPDTNSLSGEQLASAASEKANEDKQQKGGEEIKKISKQTENKNNNGVSEVDFSTFEDAQYVQAVIEAIRFSSRERKWTKVMIKADDQDPLLQNNPNSMEQPLEFKNSSSSSNRHSQNSGYFFSHKHNIPAQYNY